MKLQKNEKPETKAYDLIDFDVWGTQREDWEINETKVSVVEIDETSSRKEVASKLKENGFIKTDDLRRLVVEETENGWEIAYKKGGLPVCRLQEAVADPDGRKAWVVDANDVGRLMVAGKTLAEAVKAAGRAVEPKNFRRNLRSYGKPNRVLAVREAGSWRFVREAFSWKGKPTGTFLIGSDPFRSLTDREEAEAVGVRARDYSGTLRKAGGETKYRGFADGRRFSRTVLKADDVKAAMDSLGKAGAKFPARDGYALPKETESAAETLGAAIASAIAETVINGAPCGFMSALRKPAKARVSRARGWKRKEGRWARRCA